MKIFESLSGSVGSAQTPAERERAAKELSQKCGYAAAALTFVPIPGSEILGVMPIHVGMVMGIGQIYGVDVTQESARQLLAKVGATVGLSLMGSQLATTAAKVFLPVVGGLVGGLVGASFMYASTVAVGTVARVFFERQGELGEDELKSIYEDALRTAKKEYDPAKAKAADAQDLAEEAAREGEQDPETRRAAAEATGQDAAAAEAGAAPAPAAEDPVTRLERLKALLDRGLIEPEEYAEVKRRVLDAI